MTVKKFKSIKVGKQGGMWAIGKDDDRIYNLVGDAGVVSWIADESGKAVSIAAGLHDLLWAINQDGEIWRKTNAGPYTPEGQWDKITTKSGKNDAKSIAADNDGHVWYTQTDDKIFRSKDPVTDAKEPTWIDGPEGGKSDNLAPFSGSILYCTNEAGQIWLNANSNWTEFKTKSKKPDASMVSVGNDQTIAYVDKNGSIFRFKRPNEGAALPSVIEWENPPMGKVSMLAVYNKDVVWCLNTKGEVWRTMQDGDWVEMLEKTGQFWHYTVKPNDTLNGIVMREFNLNDAAEITKKADLIAGQSGLINPNDLKVGDQLTMYL